MQEAMPTKALSALQQDQPMTLGDLASAPAINIQDNYASMKSLKHEQSNVNIRSTTQLSGEKSIQQSQAQLPPM